MDAARLTVLEQLGVAGAHRLLQLLDSDPRPLRHRLGRQRGPQHVDALPVALRLGAEPAGHQLASHLRQLLERPHEELALHALGVGVLRGEEPAVSMAQVAQQVGGRPAHHLAVPLGAGDLPRPRVQADELRVVVEHLLEMRDQPAMIRRVAVEAAAELVEDPAGRHPVQRELHHLQRLRPAPKVAAQQELQGHRLRELGRRGEAAPPGIEPLPDPLQRLPQHPLVQLARGPGERAGLHGDVLSDLPALLARVLAAVPPGVRDRQEHLAEARHAEPVAAGEIGPREERLPLGRQHHRHRPAALTGHRLHRAHVDGVDVRPLLPVHLDAHEVLVHERRGVRVLERLVRHHVAPVTGRVPHRQQDRLVLGPGALHRLGTPRVPVNRVVGVLEQVRAGLAGEAVDAAPLGSLSHVHLHAFRCQVKATLRAPERRPNRASRVKPPPV